jgi:hypothetical protein
MHKLTGLLVGLGSALQGINEILAKLKFTHFYIQLNLIYAMQYLCLSRIFSSKNTVELFPAQ